MKYNGWKPCATSLPTFPRGTAGEDARAQTEALKSIQALIEKTTVHDPAPASDTARKVEPLRSRVGRKVVVK